MVKIGQTACWRLKVNYNKGREVLFLVFLNSYTTSADQTNVWILLLTQWVTQKKTFLLLLPIMYACVGVVAVELVNLSQSVTYCSYLWALRWRFSLKRSPAPVNCSLWSGYGQVSVSLLVLELFIRIFLFIFQSYFQTPNIRNVARLIRCRKNDSLCYILQRASKGHKDS